MERVETPAENYQAQECRYGEVGGVAGMEGELAMGLELAVCTLPLGERSLNRQGTAKVEPSSGAWAAVRSTAGQTVAGK